MSCRFCGTEQHTVRVVAYNATVTYACGTSFFPTDHELGEPFDACWSQSKECKEKATATNPSEMRARLAALEDELERKVSSANTRLDCALVRGNRLRNVMSMLTPPDEDTRLLMHAAADEWDEFLRITTDSRNASKAWQASNES